MLKVSPICWLDCSFASSLRTASSRLQNDGSVSLLNGARVMMGATSVTPAQSPH
jgi:hypothetical protein